MRISDWSSDVCSSDLVPVDAAVAGDLRQACRHVDEGVPVAAAGFEQQPPAARVFGQAVGKHAAGGTGTDDDVVVGGLRGVAGVGPPSKLGSGPSAYALRAVARRGGRSGERRGGKEWGSTVRTW